MSFLVNSYRYGTSAAVTWNPSDIASGITLSGSNLIGTRDVTGTSAWRDVRATRSLTNGNGKRQFEIANLANGGANGSMIGGIAQPTESLNNQPGGTGGLSYGCQANNTSGARTYFNNSATVFGPFLTPNSGGINRLGVQVDLDAGKIWFSLSGSSLQGNPVTGTSPIYTWTPGSLVFFPILGLFDDPQSCKGYFTIADMLYPFSGFTGWSD